MNRRAASTRQGVKLGVSPPKWLFFAIFAVSGFSGLIYESIWSHYLKLFLGHAAYAQSLVLMIFMGGLALGSWLASRFSPRWRLPILIYAVVEGAIGIAALVFHEVFVGVADGFYFSILPAVHSASLASVLKWGAATALILPQSVLLGMTFPLMSSGLIRRYPDHPGGSLAMLYFTNSIGAAIGVLISGFWLIRTVGLPGTILTAGLLNIALALLVWALVKLDPEPAPRPARALEHDATDDGDDLATLFFFAAGVTGAASFIYEIGWLRMLSLVLGSTTHSFELMLSAFITGLAFGGLWIRRRIDGIADAVGFSGWVQVLMGCAAVATVPLYVLTFDWMAAILAALAQSAEGYTLFTLLSHGIALLVMVPTTFLAGMTLPLFTNVLMRGREGERAIGRVYAANTFGAIVGVLFAVHIGMPLLGLKMLIALGALLDILLGLALLHRSYRRSPQPGRLTPVVPAVAIGASALIAVLVGVNLDPKRLASGVYRYRSPVLDEQTTSVFYRDGKTATISLTARAGQLSISTNGKPDASIQMDPNRPTTSDESTQTMLAVVPLAYNSAARRAATIGLGSGLTTHMLLADPDLEQVDTIEIEPAVVEAAHGFGERVSRAFYDPRSKIHVEDAKTFFSVENRRYDIIVAEPSNPWVSGVASLFSDEFYRTSRNYLTPDGVFVQWLQLYEFTDDLVFSVLKALSSNFSDFVVYNTNDSDLLIVAKANGQLGEPRFDRVLGGAFKADLARVGLNSAEDFLVRRTGSKRSLAGLLAHSPIPANSDYFPYLDLNAGEARFTTDVAGLFQLWSLATLPILEMIGVAQPDFGRVTADRHFKRTRAVAMARAGHAAAIGDDVPAGTLSAPLHQALTTLRLLRESCEQGGGETQWASSLHTLAESVLPFLGPAMGEELLARVGPKGCDESVSEPLRPWMALYESIAARDADAMAQRAQAILADEQNLDEARRHYLLAAAMLGRVAQGNAPAALELWKRYGGSDAGAEPSPDVRLLLAMALDGKQEFPTHLH